jgi:dienelactone hydrolase
MSNSVRKTQMRFSAQLLLCWGMISVVALASSGSGQGLPIENAPALDQSNSIRNYLMRVAQDLTHRSLSDIHTLDQWQEQRNQRHAQFLEMMGLVDVPVEGPRPDLNVQITGTIQRPGYRIEKLYYEALPQLYVPANLYIPEGLSKPAPAILYVCGHSRTQKVSYQAHARRFAELGFVCLIFETIQWGEVQGEHWGCYARGWFHWYSRGYTPGGVELWNALRGLDLLCARPEVDANKLGVTGISGGGTQTWYVAAADSRIKAAATVCGTTTVNSHVHQQTIDGHCDCMMPINTYQQDFIDIGALIAPRPLMIASAQRDGLNAIEAVRDVYHRAKSMYELHGQPDNLVLVETPGGHSYHPISRTRIFSFFLKHLMGRDVPASQIADIDDSPSAQLSADELRAYAPDAPPDDRTKTIQDSFIKLAEAPRLTSTQALYDHQAKVRTFLQEKTFGAFPTHPVPLDMRWEFRADDGASHGKHIYSFVTEQGLRLRVDVRWRGDPHEVRPIMLVLRSPHEKRWASEGAVSGLSQAWNIAYLECRGLGATGWAPNQQWHIRRAAAWTGRTVASMRVYDVLRCVQALRRLKGVQGEHIAIYARGEMCAIASYAAFLDQQIHSVLLRDPPATQNTASNADGRGTAIEMLNCLRITDLAQVTGLLYPGNVAVMGSVSKTYDWAQDLYERLGKPEHYQRISKTSDWMP